MLKRKSRPVKSGRKSPAKTTPSGSKKAYLGNRSMSDNIISQRQEHTEIWAWCNTCEANTIHICDSGAIEGYCYVCNRLNKNIRASSLFTDKDTDPGGVV